MTDGIAAPQRRPKRRTPLLVAVAAVLAVALAGVAVLALQEDADSPVAQSPRPGIPAPPPLTWRGCGSGGLECAERSVPLDHGEPTGRQITLALNRRPATGPGTALGSLVINPGGPGASGVAFVRDSVEAISSGVRARYGGRAGAGRPAGLRGAAHAGR